jgi:hypothetical protein
MADGCENFRTFLVEGTEPNLAQPYAGMNETHHG